MKIAVRLLPNDRWHNFESPPRATLADFKAHVLQYWGIVPAPQHISIDTAYSNSDARAQKDESGRRTYGDDSLDRKPPVSSARSSSATGSTAHAPRQSPPAPVNAFSRHVAETLGRYSFRSVCLGHFLPEDAAVSDWCVEHDILLIQPRNRAICLDTEDFLHPFLLVYCFARFIKGKGKEAANVVPPQRPLQSIQVESDTLSVTSSSRTSDSHASFTPVSPPEHSRIEADRHFKAVKLQVLGDQLWIWAQVRYASQEAEADCLGRYTLPVLTSTCVSSSKGSRQLHLVFFEGQRVILQARDDQDLADLLRVLGPQGTTSSIAAMRAVLHQRQNIFSRALRSNLAGLWDVRDVHVDRHNIGSSEYPKPGLAFRPFLPTSTQASYSRHIAPVEEIASPETLGVSTRPATAVDDRTLQQDTNLFQDRFCLNSTKSALSRSSQVQIPSRRARSFSSPQYPSRSYVDPQLPSYIEKPAARSAQARTETADTSPGSMNGQVPIPADVVGDMAADEPFEMFGSATSSLHDDYAHYLRESNAGSKSPSLDGQTLVSMTSEAKTPSAGKGLSNVHGAPGVKSVKLAQNVPPLRPRLLAREDRRGPLNIELGISSGPRRFFTDASTIAK